MKYLLGSILAIFLNFSIQAKESKFGELSFKKAVNLSGKQRMLSQRIAKIFVLKYIGANGLNIERDLKSAQILFERNLNILKENGKSQSAKVKAKIHAESREWFRFKDALNDEKESLEEMLVQAEELLVKCHELVLAIEEASDYTKQISYDSSTSQMRVQTINKAGRQRMLSQKMCLYYAASRAFKDHQKAEDAKKIYRGIYAEMNKVINDLMVSEFNDSKIDLTISEILNTFELIENDKKHFLDNKIPLLTILQTSDKLLNEFNKLTNLYSISY